MLPYKKKIILKDKFSSFFRCSLLSQHIFFLFLKSIVQGQLTDHLTIHWTLESWILKQWGLLALYICLIDKYHNAAREILLPRQQVIKKMCFKLIWYTSIISFAKINSRSQTCRHHSPPALPAPALAHHACSPCPAGLTTPVRND